jgi:hypothetical protein
MKKPVLQKLDETEQHIACRIQKNLIAVLLAFGFGISGCTPVSEAASQSQDSTMGSAYEAYCSALLGQGQIFCSTGGEASPQSINISEVPAVFSPDSEYAEIWRFALVDLDGNGENETVLQIIDAARDMGGFLVLQWKDGKVWGYPQSYREFESLKTDGTYGFSNPTATEWGICTGGFLGNEYMPQTLISGKTEDNWESIGYSVYGQTASEEDYNAAMAQQEEKPDAAWYEFTDENLEKVFSGTPPQPLTPENTPAPSQISQQAAQALEADFREYWDTVKDGMVLSAVNVFRSDCFTGMDQAVFVVYSAYKTTCTVVYSITGNTVKRLGEVPTGFDFALSSANGGMFRTSWKFENKAAGNSENDDNYYTVSPEEIESVLCLGASVFEGEIREGYIYQEDGTVHLTAEEYRLRKEEADKDFSDVQMISFVPADFGTSGTGFDISSGESFAEYILQNCKKTNSDRGSEQDVSAQNFQKGSEPSANPSAVMNEEQQRYYDTYLRTWGTGSPFDKDFTENDDPIAAGKLYFIFHSLFYLDHPDNGDDILEQLTSATVIGSNGTEEILPAELFENTITSHFNTTVQALKENLKYNNKDFYDAATDTYHFGVGRGGAFGVFSTVSDIRQDGDLLELEYNWFSKEYHPAQLIKSSVVTIRLLPDGGWKYIANRVTFNINDNK